MECLLLAEISSIMRNINEKDTIARATVTIAGLKVDSVPAPVSLTFTPGTDGSCIGANSNVVFAIFILRNGDDFDYHGIAIWIRNISFFGNDKVYHLSVGRPYTTNDGRATVRRCVTACSDLNRLGVTKDVTS